MRNPITKRALDNETTRTFVVGLLCACPVSDNPEHCQCHELRKMPIKERLEWLKGKSDEECSEIFKRHQACLSAMEEEEYRKAKEVQSTG